MTYTLYRPIYDENGFYSHLEYWNGKEFTIDQLEAVQFPNREACLDAYLYNQSHRERTYDHH